MQKIFRVKPGLNWKIAMLTIVSTLALMVDYYHFPIFPWGKIFSWWGKTGLSMKILDRTLLYFIIPLIFILVIFRESPKNYGFTFGDWKAGIIITLSCIILITPVLFFVGRGDAALEKYYKPMVAGLPLNTFLDLFGWEFFFRGWLLFGYTRKFGTDGIWLQAVPFAMAHMGKPELETLSTIFGGFIFGWVAWRTKSFVYPLIIHWFVASFTIIVAAGFLG